MHNEKHFYEITYDIAVAIYCSKDNKTGVKYISTISPERITIDPCYSFIQKPFLLFDAHAKDIHTIVMQEFISNLNGQFINGMHLSCQGMVIIDKDILKNTKDYTFLELAIVRMITRYNFHTTDKTTLQEDLEPTMRKALSYSFFDLKKDTSFSSFLAGKQLWLKLIAPEHASHKPLNGDTLARVECEKYHITIQETKKIT